MLDFVNPVVGGDLLTPALSTRLGIIENRSKEYWDWIPGFDSWYQVVPLALSPVGSNPLSTEPGVAPDHHWVGAPK